MAWRRRGVGPAGRRLRHVERAGQLPGVRRAAPAARRRRRRTACWTWPAVRGWPSSWLRPGAPRAPASTPRPGSSRSPPTATRTPTCASATCTRCRGTTARSTSSRASGASGARRRTPSPRSTACSPPAGASASPCGATSSSRRGRGRCARSRWPARPRSPTRRRWWRSADPGAGEALLADAGFVDIERVEIPFAWEFADPESYARALASTGPAYEAIQAVGEEAFVQSAIDVAAERVRDGLPLRADDRRRRLRGPQGAGRGRRAGAGAGFLGAAPPSGRRPAALRRGRRGARAT